MKILIGCEFSGIVRDKFIRRGHDAVSCDLIPSSPTPRSLNKSDAGQVLAGKSRDEARVILHAHVEKLLETL